MCELLITSNRLKCGRCNKNKHQPQFSSKQLAEYRAKLLDGYRNPSVNCRVCSGGQVVELSCIECGKTKGLEEFAKAQRSNPDRAKCMACMEKHLALTPIDEDRYEAPESTPVSKVIAEEAANLEYYDSAYGSSSLASENGDTSYGGGVALDQELEKLKLASSRSGTTEDGYAAARPINPWVGYDSSDTGLGSSVAGMPMAAKEEEDEWKIAKGKSSRATSSLRSKTPSTGFSSGGFDPTKYGHPAGRGSTTGSSVAGSVHSAATQRTVNAGGSKFAKIKAYVSLAWTAMLSCTDQLLETSHPRARSLEVR
ncbi:uncharacterized protein BDZ99DRAFT_156424 [Mytilinidion resinicola]|uniref:Stc1 domain-containing protein n=1 Tax=Mytilinidion resinicola TaxID=574789 RepID=A0A6A6Y816_9PEZI|nr:uncharacterized protein BDZ99DRAFT_156424 [Mytilinidion resinicola]KAF2803957.1 hypothetical protein BDZ99DRAFT_156424 [Mytilinidion resinicola]